MVASDRDLTRAITKALRHKYLEQQAGWSLLLEVTLDDLEPLAGKKPTRRNRRRAGAPTRRRIDALLIRTAKSNKPFLETIALEVKVSRADFKRDTPEKRRAWMAAANRFAYIAPAGLIPKDEVPEGCGLIEYENGALTWKVMAPVTAGPDDWAPDFRAYLLRRLCWAEENARRALP